MNVKLNLGLITIVHNRTYCNQLVEQRGNFTIASTHPGLSPIEHIWDFLEGSKFQSQRDIDTVTSVVNFFMEQFELCLFVTSIMVTINNK